MIITMYRSSSHTQQFTEVLADLFQILLSSIRHNGSIWIMGIKRKNIRTGRKFDTLTKILSFKESN